KKKNPCCRLCIGYFASLFIFLLYSLFLRSVTPFLVYFCLSQFVLYFLLH
ncbi:hypothetical protein V1514DRAFT_337247, partial [Lipomyces japonicus]